MRNPEPLPRLFVLAAAAALSLQAGRAGAGIPERPESLKFPAFTFTPPSAAAYRIQLGSGPIAFVAEDRELPLVTITVTLRGGKYL